MKTLWLKFNNFAMFQSETSLWALAKEYWELFVYVAGVLLLLYRQSKRTIPKVTNSFITIKEFVGTARLLQDFKKTINERLDELLELSSYNRSRIELMTDVAIIPIWRANAKGECVYVNDSYCSLFGKEADELLGDGWFSIIAPGEQARVQHLWSNAVTRQIRTYFEFDVTANDKTIRRAKVYVHPHFSRKGDFIEFQGTIQLI